jgi:hypothetical protein
VIPREWVGDTFIELAKSQRATRPLDYKMNQGRSTVTLPDSGASPFFLFRANNSSLLDNVCFACAFLV